jgi:phosphoribosylformimino-5-aminoimidazole carboxamide ribotide isomerase
VGTLALTVLDRARSSHRGRFLTFEVIPAIDLREGRCVRLFQGDYARETSYSDDPAGVARRWESLGAPRLHVVDLDGARAGEPRNRSVMAAICAAAGIPVEVSGGIRTIESIRDAFAYGARRVQLGSAAVRDPALVGEATAEFPGMIVVAIDSRDGDVRTDGWEGASGLNPLDLARRMVEAGVPRLMFTDIGRDSTLTEPNFAALAELVEQLPVPVVASGGVAKLADLRRLAALGCEGAIIGKALYEGTVDLAEAIAAFRA